MDLDPGTERFDFLSDWVMRILNEHDKMGTVWMEGYSYGSKGSRVFEIGENSGILKLKLFSNGIPFRVVPPTVIKKHATGKGNASKDEMVASARARGHAPTDDNEADALARLRPLVDGLILSYRGRRATFLPQVWESLRAPGDFLAQLKLKAGLPADFWHADVVLARYAVRKWHEAAR